MRQKIMGFLLLGMSIFSCGLGQGNGFQYRYTGYEVDNPRMVLDQSNLYALTGEYKGVLGAASQCVFFGKIKDDGTLMQSERICPTMNCLSAGRDLRKTANGFVIGGYADCSDSSGLDGLLVKLSPGGGLRWSARYGGTGSDQFHAMAVMYDGGFLAAGSSDSYVIGGTANLNMYIIRTDSNGLLQTGFVYGWTDADEAFDLIETQDSAALMVGYVTNQPIGLPKEKDFYMVKTDAYGGPIWRIRYDLYDDEMFRSVVQDPGSQHFYFTGETDSAGLIRPFLMETDPMGNAVNMIIYDPPAGASARGLEIRLEGANNAIAIVGEELFPSQKGFVLRTDMMGTPFFWSTHEGESLNTVRWTNNDVFALGTDIQNPSSGNPADELYALRNDAGGITDTLCNDSIAVPTFKFALPGGISLPDTFFFGEDLRGMPMFDSLILLNRINLCLATDLTEPVGFGISASPNPFDDLLSIRINSQGPVTGKLEIWNAGGKKVYARGMENEHSPEFSISGLTFPDGVYLLRLESEGEVITRKLLKLTE